jgi:RNA polymerase sigma-70 factor (ECF subfamily)
MALLEHDILRILMHSRDRIAAAAWIVVRDGQASEDIFQNVAIKAMTKQVCFEAAVLSWAMITARREAIDWVRRHRNESTMLDTDILDLLEQEWLAASDRISARSEALRACLRRLPRKSKELLRLRYRDGLACSRVAEQLGDGLDVVYKRLSRLHHTLRDCIEGRLADSRTSRS